MSRGLFLLLLFFLSACHFDPARGLHKTPPRDRQSVEFTGTVVRVPLEGGFYGLRDDAGRQYEPRNLPAALRRNGLRVRVRGRLVKGAASFRQWGALLDIQHIEPR